MTLNLSMLLKADGSNARAEVDATGKSVKKLGSETEQTGRKSKTAAGGTRSLGSASRKTMGEVQSLAAAERAAAIEASNLGRSNKMAAGQMGNLTAQFNDIGVMLAAGQNPLQLALQQGTQITQVIGPMGAAGAVKALGGAFVQMLNPVSLITIGSIAAGAALFGMLRNAWPEAVKLDDILGDLADSVDRYADASERARSSSKDLVEDFGSKSAEVRLRLKKEAKIDRQIALAEMKTTAEVLAKSIGGLSHTDQISDGYGQFLSKFENTHLNMQIDYGLTVDQATKLLGAMEAINQAATPENAIDAANQFSDALFSVFSTASNIPEAMVDAVATAREFRDAGGKILSLDEAATRSKAAQLKDANAMLATLDQETTERALIAAHGKESAEVFNHQLKIERARYELKVKELPLAKKLMAAWDQSNQARDPQQERLQNAYRYYALTRQQSAEAQRSAQVSLANLQTENTLRTAIRQHGEGSLAVAELREAQARRVNEVWLSGQDVAESLKEELRGAFEQGLALERLDIKSGLSSAAKEAMQIADALGLSYDMAVKLAALGPQGLGANTPKGGRGSDPRKFGGSAFDWQVGDATQFLDNWKPPKKRRGGGSKKQENALARLIAKEQIELSVLRTVDPVQKELLKNREALAVATNVERDMVTRLITERIRETAQMEALQESYDFFGNEAVTFFDDLRRSGGSLNDVLGNLIDKLASAAIQATILGTGPLASLFGTSGGGGLLGAIFGPVFKADGGPVIGEGGPRDDKVLMFASPDEYVVNALQSKRHRPLLDAINSGSVNNIPALASGGVVGPISTPPSFLSHNINAQPNTGSGISGKVVVELRLSDDLDARIESQSQDVAVRVVREGIEDFSNEGLTYRVKQIAADDRAIG